MNRKLNILLMIMFLLGSMIFLLPILDQLKEVDEDDHLYAAMSKQFRLGSPLAEGTAPEPDSAMVDVTPSAEGTALQTMLPALLDVPQTSEPADGSLSESEPGATQVSDAASSAFPVSTPKPGAVDLQSCLHQNGDFVAWITIPGTPVDYPVVQSSRTDYYLKHLFTGESSKLGCLFSLPSSDYQTPGRNIAIYGHHLSHSDAMFSSLVNYKDPSYCTAHPVIELQTIYGDRLYRVFAVINMKVSDWDPATGSFSDRKEFQIYVDRARKKVLYDTAIEVDADDRILTLITCDRSYGGVSGRLIVMAVEE